MNIKKSMLGLSFVAFTIAPSMYVYAKNLDVSTEQLQKIVDDYYKKYSSKEKFTAISASVLIPQDKKADFNNIKTVVAGTVGVSPLNQQITTDNLFDIGSITKSFTALLLLQLQAEGKLSLDDPLGKYLPQYRNWEKVTLRQLLNMTTGIPNYSENVDFDKIMYGDLSKVWSDEELLAYADPDQSLKIDKNKLYEYCNSNYILAALVVEKVTNDSFENQLKKRILSQKDYFKNSFYPAGPSGQKVEHALLNRRVHGYFYDEKNKKLQDTINNDLSWAGAAGAIVANTEDVIRWVQLLYHGTLIDPQNREKALTELKSVVSLKTGQPLSNVTENDPAGFGLGVAYMLDKTSGQRFWFYEGSTLGFRVAYFWSACNDVTVAVALNSKGGEGDANSKIGDHISELNRNLYQAILEKNPQLNCKNK